MVLGEQGKWLGVLGPEMRIVEMSCESGGWAKVARLESGVRGTMVSCQLGRETRGTVLEAASRVGFEQCSECVVERGSGARAPAFFALRVEFVAGAREPG